MQCTCTGNLHTLQLQTVWKVPASSDVLPTHHAKTLGIECATHPLGLSPSSAALPPSPLPSSSSSSSCFTLLDTVRCRRDNEAVSVASGSLESLSLCFRLSGSPGVALPWLSAPGLDLAITSLSCLQLIHRRCTCKTFPQLYIFI